MYTFIYKKIIKISNKISIFIRENLVQIVIIGGLFVLLQIIKSFPYVNIIPNYQFLVIGFILFLTVILLRVSISNKKITFIVLILFFLAALSAIFDLALISDLIGFVVFVLLTLVVVSQIVRDRGRLKKTDFYEDN